MTFFNSSSGKIIADTPCPHCNKQSTYEQVRFEDDEVREKTLVYDDMGSSFPYVIRFTIYRCEFCNHFRVNARRIKQYYDDRIVVEYPLPNFSGIDRNKIGHQIILGNLDEGMRCLNADSPKGAIVNFRRALEAAVLILHGEGADLKQKIDDLYVKEIIRAKTKDMAHQVRAFGNLGAHPYEIKIDVNGTTIADNFNELTLEDARRAAKMLLLFLEDAFIFPSELEDVDGRLGELKS